MQVHRIAAYAVGAVALAIGLHMLLRGDAPPAATGPADADEVLGTAELAPPMTVTEVSVPGAVSAPVGNIRSLRDVESQRRGDQLRTVLEPLAGEAVYVQGLDDLTDESPHPAAPARPRLPGPGDAKRR